MTPHRCLEVLPSPLVSSRYKPYELYTPPKALSCPTCMCIVITRSIYTIHLEYPWGSIVFYSRSAVGLLSRHTTHMHR